jgi:MFS family permease
MLSLTLFSAAALACGLSDSLGSLIFWRALQGIGGLLIPVGQSLTWQLFQPHERAKLGRRDAGRSAGPGLFSGSRWTAG